MQIQCKPVRVVKLERTQLVWQHGVAMLASTVRQEATRQYWVRVQQVHACCAQPAHIPLSWVRQYAALAQQELLQAQLDQHHQPHVADVELGRGLQVLDCR